MSAEIEFNGRDCPYFWRHISALNHDPHAVCVFGCREEPSCITDEPTGGWPESPHSAQPTESRRTE